MRELTLKTWLPAAACLTMALSGCEQKPEQAAAPEAAPEKPAVVLKGVDTEKKVVSIGVLVDESGPAAAIGKPYAVGHRVLAAQVNAGGSGILPEGWTINLVERDHGYNPQRSVQLYNEIKDQVLYFGNSFGTPNTLPLRPMLKRDGIVAFPASLSSKMAEFEYTPPVGPTYKVEAMRAMDFAVEQAGSAEAVKAAIIYQQDDYGADGHDGWHAAAKHHGVEVVAMQEVAPGQADFTAVVTALKKAGATHVMLTALPSATGPIVGTAAQLKYMPVWIGNTASWIDRFFDPNVIPSAVFTHFHLATGLPFWGEELPGMAEFVAAYEQFGKESSAPDSYILMAYLQGMVGLQVVAKAIESGDLSRAGYLKALRSIANYTMNGMSQPISFTEMPYVVGTRTRILKPNFEAGSWTVASDYAEPLVMAAAPAADGAPAEAPAEEPAAAEQPAAE